MELIYQEIQSDDLTPIVCFHALGGEGSCILECETTSIVGISPLRSLIARGTSIHIVSKDHTQHFIQDPYEALSYFAKDHKTFGLVSYDAVRTKEKLPDLHPPKEAIPDFLFHIYQTLFIFDHQKKTLLCIHAGEQSKLNALLQQCYASSRLKPFKKRSKLAFTPSLSRQEFADLVQTAQDYIKAGDVFQIVLSRTFQTKIRASAFDIYRALRQISPAPYLFFFQEKDFAVAGASPELLISVKDSLIESMPIAGTSAKTAPPSDLLQDPKECAEHVMLIDLARNDVGSIAKVGSVQVPETMKVLSFSHVNHIVSRVTGELKNTLKPLEALKAALPAGTLSGAPKIRAMELIEALETKRRGFYGGAVVSIDEQGNFTSAIAIRMALIQQGVVEIQTGAGIVLDSQGEKEAMETEIKARALFEALELAEGGLQCFC